MMNNSLSEVDSVHVEYIHLILLPFQDKHMTPACCTAQETVTTPAMKDLTKVSATPSELEVSFSSLPDISITSAVDLDLSVTDLFPTSANHSTPGCKEKPDGPRYTFGNRSYPAIQETQIPMYYSIQKSSPERKLIQRSRCFFVDIR